MANYYEKSVSNYFKTVDNEEVLSVLDRVYGVSETGYEDDSKEKIYFGNNNSDETLSLDETHLIFRKNTDDLVEVYDSSVDEMENYVEDVEQFYEVSLVKYLQDMLVEGGHIEIYVVGNEKLRYLTGEVIIITKTEYVGHNLQQVAEELRADLGIKED